MHPLIQLWGRRVHAQEKERGMWVGAWAYAFGACQALGYASIRPLGYASAILRPSLGYAA